MMAQADDGGIKKLLESWWNLSKDFPSAFSILREYDSSEEKMVGTTARITEHIYILDLHWIYNQLGGLLLAWFMPEFNMASSSRDRDCPRVFWFADFLARAYSKPVKL